MNLGREELDERLSRHPDEETLVEFYLGRLHDFEHVTVECHLIDCEECAGVVRDASAFLNATVKSDAAMSEKETAEVWRNVQKNTTGGLKKDKRSNIILSRWPALAIGAIAALLLVAAFVWIVRLKQANERLGDQTKLLSAQLEESRSDLNRRIEENDKGPLREETAQEPARNDKPQEERHAPLTLNVPVHNIYSRDWVRRSGGVSELNRIKLLSGAESVVLVLVADGQEDYPDYAIEIIGPKRRSVHYNKGLSKNSLGNFVISLNREFLLPGTYRIIVRGLKGSVGKRLTEYLVNLE